MCIRDSFSPRAVGRGALRGRMPAKGLDELPGAGGLALRVLGSICVSTPPAAPARSRVCSVPF
eukprot:14880496-Alexandrium_andersonii.AAC.1